MGRTIFLILFVLAACGQGRQPEGNSAAAPDAAIDQGDDKCGAPALATPDGDRHLASALLEETRANFETAYANSCAKELLKVKPLIDAKAADQTRLFLVNAPEANVASIYLSEVDGNRMVLEYPFLTTDGVSHVPTAAELEEAIYCAVVGATPQEQEGSGRCLVD